MSLEHNHTPLSDIITPGKYGEIEVIKAPTKVLGCPACEAGEEQPK